MHDAQCATIAISVIDHDSQESSKSGIAVVRPTLVAAPTAQGGAHDRR